MTNLVKILCDEFNPCVNKRSKLTIILFLFLTLRAKAKCDFEGKQAPFINLSSFKSLQSHTVDPKEMSRKEISFQRT